ncbi:hypothetical protein M3Y94_00343300 [Aphelenchoides besseyi]|nr:hypothetical protein M3Y94_00343300 [Aphelenchoides besseyi]KAI6235421.1 hypothetical protein M3Y95_00049900 [Aphelenchoides besseyi]
MSSAKSSETSTGNKENFAEHSRNKVEECMNQECRWVQRARALKTFDDIETALFDCVCRLNITKKLTRLPKLTVKGPESRTVSLVSHVNRDSLSGKITLFAEDLQSAEVSFKHLRINGGVYRAQIKSPYKIQQLQDCGNKVVRAMKALYEGREKYEKITKNGNFSQYTGNCLSAILQEIRDAVKSCLLTLSPPNLRTYHELYNASVVGYFDPPPPSDLLFSYYISTDRLICTAYQMAPKQGNTHCLTSFHSESRLDTLAQLHEVLSRAHWSAASLLITLDMFHAYQSKLNPTAISINSA